ncbi:N-6 DNA methylase [Haloarcula sp. Atlit-7R]|uniref:N-6 DNA methylase n=1 Tax=Haloarcula sp. Atlit-7R TaxID=2282125 RepID=UPI000EF16791|nr:N-6 DNA methylase [Haloarcula sp. Atlit-7R]RLM94394.1 SAM-dependent DNA methyltransferase [Haloarcula sp. Atlit-7R]
MSADTSQSSTAGSIDCSPIISPLETIERRGFSRHNLFRDWLELILSALQRDDDTYLSTLEKYNSDGSYKKGNRNADLFSKSFGELIRLTRETNLDVLGDVYEEFGMSSSHFGQYFTPHPAAKMVAGVSVDESHDSSPVSIADPTCGSGRLLVYAARNIDEEVWAFGQDLDEMCARMAAINFTLFNLNGIIIQGDSLKLTKHRAWQTTHSKMGGGIREIDPKQCSVHENALRDAKENSQREDSAQHDENSSVTDLSNQTDISTWT